MTPTLEAAGLVKHFGDSSLFDWRKTVPLRAVDGVDVTLFPGETLGIVGESGCGKTTLGRLLALLDEPTAGEIHFEGKSIERLKADEPWTWRRLIQVVFQDAGSAFNPKLTVGSALSEPLRNFDGLARREAIERARSLMSRVGLSPDMVSRYPHEFSGGQRQRLGIARALAAGPRLVIADEPVSALDVSIQAQILNLLVSIQEELLLSLIFISHDLGVVRHVSRRVAVMYLGVIVETAPVEELFRRPQHPYTRALLEAAPTGCRADRVKRRLMSGDLPDARHPPAGCRFSSRCPIAEPRCRTTAPPLLPIGTGHLVACHVVAGSSAGARQQKHVRSTPEQVGNTRQVGDQHDSSAV